MLTTEKVARKSLDSADHKKLVDEALAEVDFSASLSQPRTGHEGIGLMEEIARVYAEALFDAAKEAGKLDVIKEQLDQFADALSENRELQLFLFSPYFSSAEKQDGLAKAIDGAEPELVNFLGLLAEKHRLPVIFRIRRPLRRSLGEENKRPGVTVTSAVELDPELVERIGEEIEKQTGQTVELRSVVDGDVLGRPRAAGSEHGAGRQHPQQAGETSKERREAA